MNQAFSPPSLSIFLLLLHLIEPALSVDEFFGTCVPASCGKGPSISYPFRISELQPVHCGMPFFELSCKDREPVITLQGVKYAIKNISYENRSFLVVNQDWIGKKCKTSLSNLAFLQSAFSISKANHYLLFLFNCTTSLPLHSQYKNYMDFSCSSNFTNHSFALLNGTKNHLNSSMMPTGCKSSVSLPVMPNSSRKYYWELLEDGFLVDWYAPDCSVCNRSGGQCGVDKETNHFKCFCKDRPHSAQCRRKESTIAKTIITGVCSGVGSILLCSVLFIGCYHYKRNLSTCPRLLSRTISMDSSLKSDFENSLATQLFSYKELEEATSNFHHSKELGDGGFGTVYHGILQDGRNIAVKRLSENNYRRVEQYKNEIYILSQLHHQNLVTLYGCSSHRSCQLLLVYEYIPNGTVADHLHGHNAKPGDLKWPTRMRIAIETADALKYLHAVNIIHRDVKTNNILLDNHFQVKVADFGLSRLFPPGVTHVSTVPQGTPGYVDPDYHHCYQLTDKSDVYSFGVVLMELISSKPAVDISRDRDEINLADLAINKIHNKSLKELVDPTLGFDSDYEVKRMITQVAGLAFRCLQYEKEVRPSMEEVLDVLRAIQNEECMGATTKNAVTQIGEELLLLKKVPPLSPDTVTQPWGSRNTTPNTSG